MTAFWKEAHDEGGLAWDDTNNNRAFLSQTICATLNGASIYIESLRNPDKYITETGAKLNTDIQHSPLPKGPAGQFAMHTYFSHVIPNYSKNQDAAKALLKWIHTKANYEPWFVSQKGFATPPTHEWEKHKLWEEDKVMAPFKVAGLLGQTPGYPLPSSDKKAIAETRVYVPQAPRPRLRLLEDERWLAFVLLLPTLVLLGVFIAYPFLRGILLSVTDTRVGVPGHFVGLATFYKIFHDGIFRTSVYNTFVYTGVTTVFKLALGLWLAMLLNRDFRGKAFTRAFILLPFIIPTVLSTFAWKWMFDPTFSVLNW